jgi:hypothetical protein
MLPCGIRRPDARMTKPFAFESCSMERRSREAENALESVTCFTAAGFARRAIADLAATAGNRRHQQYFVAFFYGAFFAAQKANVLIV